MKTYRENTNKTEGTTTRLIILSIVLAAGILILDLSIPLGVAAGVPYVVLVLVSLWSPKKQYTFIMAISGSILTIVGFFFSPAGGEMWKAIFNRFLALFAIWVTAILSLQRKMADEALHHKAKLIQLLQEIAVTANVASTVGEAMQICIDRVCSYTGWPVGHAYIVDSTGKLSPSKLWYLENPRQFETFRKVTEVTPFDIGVGLPGRVLANGKPAWITDVTKDKNFPRAKLAKKIEVKAGFAFPVLEGNKVVAVLEFFSGETKKPDESLLDAISNLATQVGRVTERKRSEEALRYNEERLHAITCSANDAIIMIDGNSKVSFWNPAAERIFGFSSDEFEGMKLDKSIIPERYRENHLNGIAKFRKSGKGTVIGRTIEMYGLKKSGEEFPVELSISSLKIKDKWFAIGIVRDITERKKMEKNLKTLNNAIEQTMEMVVITDENGTIEYVNPAVEKITGYTREEIIGKNPRIFKSDQHDKKFYKNMWDTIKSGIIWKGQLLNKKKSGKLYDEDMTISPVKDILGNITNFIAIKRDVSEAKNLRQQLIQAEKLSSIGTFVSGVAHELNNPLSSVLGFSQSLSAKKDLPPEIVNKVKIIAQESKRAAVIVQDLLRFSRKEKTRKVPLKINDILKKMLSLQIHHFHNDRIEIKTDYSTDHPLIEGDSNQLQQVFINIILNAHNEITRLKSKGVLAIKTETKENEVVISFENNGPPIPGDLLNKIFEPFFTTKKIGAGTGLGLSISYGIIKDHGGKIWAENNGNSGVRFIITLPLVFEEAQEFQPQTKDLSVQSDIRVLLVYEGEETCRSIISFLKKKGVSVLSAKNGKEVEDLLEQKDFDIIFSDIRLPRMDGLKLGKWLKKNKPEYLKKFVILTGIIDKKIEDYCAKFHCEYLIKPVNEERVIESILRITQKNVWH